ncbi:MAG: hypothetical protein ACOC2O_00940 [Bacillota bacterium]
MDEVTKEDLNQLINYEQEPCVSLYMNTRKDAGAEMEKMRISFKNLLSEVEKKLEKDWKMDSRKQENFLDKAKKLIGERTFWQHQSEGLAMFIGPDIFSYYRIPVSVKNQVSISKYFNIIDLIPEYQDQGKYYVLALSRKKSQFFLSTKEGIQDIEIDNMPREISDIEKGVEIEEEPQYRSQSSYSSGQQEVFHGESHGDEKHPQNFLKFIKQINKAINKYLQEKQKPLILMCVQDLFPIYQKVNTYPHLNKDFARGNPHRLNQEKIQQKTWEVMKNYFNNEKKELIEQFNNLQSTEKTSTKIKDIIPAAFFGKIDKLLIKKNSSQQGIYDSEKNEVFLSNKEKPEYYDLYNLAAIKTFTTGGEISLLEEEKMPGNTNIAAIYRF